MNISHSFKKYTYFFWGFFDALYIFVYTYKSIEENRVPFFSDASNIISIASSYGYPAAIYSTLSFLLHFSIIFSAILLFCNAKSAKYFCYTQIPFRLFFIVPSLSIIIIGIGLFDSYNIYIIYLLVIISEFLKFFSLKTQKLSA